MPPIPWRSIESVQNQQLQDGAEDGAESGQRHLRIRRNQNLNENETEAGAERCHIDRARSSLSRLLSENQILQDPSFVAGMNPTDLIENSLIN